MQHHEKQLKFKYKKAVNFYFDAEYSDLPMTDLIDKVKVLVPENEDLIEVNIEDLKDPELLKMQLKWQSKINKVIESYRIANKPPADAARKISNLLKSFTGISFFKERSI